MVKRSIKKNQRDKMPFHRRKKIGFAVKEGDQRRGDIMGGKTKLFKKRRDL